MPDTWRFQIGTAEAVPHPDNTSTKKAASISLAA
jgi:hypothetical protein